MKLARVSVCGQISQYNLEEPEMGPRWLNQGKLKYREDVVQGIHMDRDIFHDMVASPERTGPMKVQSVMIANMMRRMYLTDAKGAAGETLEDSPPEAETTTATKTPGFWPPGPDGEGAPGDLEQG